MNLDHYLTTATLKGVDLSGCMLSGLNTKGIDKNPNHSVTEDILTFYLAENGLALLKSEISAKQELTDEQWNLAKMYMDVCAEVGPRMFYYLMHVCIRENRHADAKCKHKAKKNVHLTDKACAFLTRIREIHDRTEIRLFVDNESNNHEPTVVNLGEMSDAVWAYFYYGSWTGGGFGGKKWADVALILKKYIHGEINTGLMIDQSANAVHNNGPIFNKHLVYENPSASELYRILDVQRAGEIIPYIKSRVCDLVKEYHLEMLRIITNAVVDNSADKVNWEEVSKHGVNKNYVNQFKKKKTIKDSYVADEDDGEYSMGCYGSIYSEERDNG